MSFITILVRFNVILGFFKILFKTLASCAKDCYASFDRIKKIKDGTFSSPISQLDVALNSV